MKPKLRILVFAAYYYPAFKAGGPVQSTIGLVDRLGDDFDFHIVAADRDLGDTTPFPGVVTDSWTRVGKAQVMYLPAGRISFLRMIRLLRETRPDLVYICGGLSLMGLRFLALRRLGLVDVKSIVIATQGVFAPSALKLKSRKKRLFLQAAKLFGLYRDVHWHASSTYELADVRREMDRIKTPLGEVLVSADLVADRPPQPRTRHRTADGALQVVFLSRICRVKNLMGALQILKDVRRPVVFNIYGPIEDPDYWEECQQQIRSLPPHVSARYFGMLDHSQVHDVFSKSDLFFLPSFGENFGHVILEAMQSGCPVLISDRTAFRNLQASGVGWDLDVDDTAGFCAMLDRCAVMSDTEWQTLSHNANSYARRFADNAQQFQQYRAFFDCVTRTNTVSDKDNRRYAA